MQKITVALPEALIEELENMAKSTFKAKMNPSGSRIELSTTIRELLDFAVKNYNNTNPNPKTLDALWLKFEAIQDELADIRATIGKLPKKNTKLTNASSISTSEEKPIVDNKSTLQVNHINTTNQPSSIDALLDSGFIEFSKEEICSRFGWNVSNKNVKSNFKNLRQYATTGGSGKYAGWVAIQHQNTYRYFFKPTME